MKKQKEFKKLRLINTFSEGEIIQGFYLCVEKNLRYTRTKDLFIDLELKDLTGHINGKIWNNVSELNGKFNAGDAVAISGTVELYKDQHHLIIKKINKATIQHYGRYGFDPANIVPTSNKNPLKMWEILRLIIKGIKNDSLRRLVENIYRINKKKLMYHPASIRLSYNYRSGLLEHILSMVQIAKKICTLYDVDKDLVIAGILLFKIGKIKEINSEFIPDYTKEGNLLGHMALGRDIIRETIKNIKNFPDHLACQIEHIILSQNEIISSRSQQKPSFPESLLINKIHDLDSKMNLMEKILEEDLGTGDFTSKYNYFRGPLLKRNES